MSGLRKNDLRSAFLLRLGSLAFWSGAWVAIDVALWPLGLGVRIAVPLVFGAAVLVAYDQRMLPAVT